MNILKKKVEEPKLRACTVSEQIEDFDLLIEDMETLLGEDWGDLGFDDAIRFFDQPDASDLEFIALAISGTDSARIKKAEDVIRAAKTHGIKVLIVAGDLGASILHTLLRSGADEFLPYPLPENELSSTVEKITKPEPEIVQYAQPQMAMNGFSRNGQLIAIHGMSGGVGATSIAVNLAHELANPGKKEKPLRTLLIDMDLQFGAISSYLDLERKTSVLQLLSDTEVMDDDSFAQAITKISENFSVLTSPADLIPLDLIDSQDVERILNMARKHFDVIIVDMPKTVANWTDCVLREADQYYGIIDLDMRTTQNIMRLVGLLEAEQQPYGKIHYILNRAPKFTDLNGKGRIKRLSEALGLEMDAFLSDGGKQVSQACDQGEPLAEVAPKNQLRKDIQKLSKLIFDALPEDAKVA